MDKEEIDKQLDNIVPAATRLKEAIRNLWLEIELEPEQSTLAECIQLSRELELKLRKAAKEIQEKG